MTPTTLNPILRLQNHFGYLSGILLIAIVFPVNIYVCKYVNFHTEYFFGILILYTHVKHFYSIVQLDDNPNRSLFFCSFWLLGGTLITVILKNLFEITHFKAAEYRPSSWNEDKTKRFLRESRNLRRSKIEEAEDAYNLPRYRECCKEDLQAL